MTALETPASNTGVHPPIDVMSFSARSKFDWYRATVPAHPDLIAEAILEKLGQGIEIKSGKGFNNYLYSHTFERGGDMVARIDYGGSNGHPSVQGPGDSAPAIAELLRANGEHKVTRCDVAVDLYGEGLYQQVSDIAHKIAKKHRVKCSEITHKNDADTGNTTYLGSRVSAVCARIYEKGKADRAKYGSVDPDVLDPWVRIELELKPQKDVRLLASTIEPVEFWGVSAWTNDLAAEVLMLSPDPIPFHPRRTASDDRAFAFMCDQYRNVLRRRASIVHGGDRDALAREIMASIFSDEVEEAA